MCFLKPCDSMDKCYREGHNLDGQEVRTVQRDFSRSEKQTGLEAWWGLSRHTEDLAQAHGQPSGTPRALSTCVAEGSLQSLLPLQEPSLNTVSLLGPLSLHVLFLCSLSTEVPFPALPLTSL